MIATVTLNPAIDKSVLAPGFEAGKTNRCEVVRLDAGGKGINVAKVLHRLGSPVCALGLIGGANGRFILEALAAEGIPADFVPVRGETRVNLKISDPEKGRETEINEPGFQVTAEELTQLKQKVKQHAAACEVVVLSGSLPPAAPPEIFAELIQLAKAQGARCFLDTNGAALALGLAAGPYLVKPNRVEVEELLNWPLLGRPELVQAARTLTFMGCEQAVISLGAEGAVGATGKQVLFAQPPVVSVRSSVGAGDTMVAILVQAAVTGMPFAEAFRMAVAASAATVSMEGTKLADPAAIQALIPQVTMEEAGA